MHKVVNSQYQNIQTLYKIICIFMVCMRGKPFINKKKGLSTDYSQGVNVLTFQNVSVLSAILATLAYLLALTLTRTY